MFEQIKTNLILLQIKWSELNINRSDFDAYVHNIYCYNGPLLDNNNTRDFLKKIWF